MTLNRSRLAVRYYLWLVEAFNDRWAVQRRLESGTTLCAFVWRIVFCTAVLVAISSIITGIIGLIVYQAVKNPIGAATGVALFIGIFTVVFGGAFLIHRAARGVRRVAQSENLVITYIKSVKRGVCPLIKFDAQ